MSYPASEENLVEQDCKTGATSFAYTHLLVVPQTLATPFERPTHSAFSLFCH